MKPVPALFASTVLALLTACGGGGGGASAPPDVAAVSITTANQNAVARAAVSGGMALALAEPLAAPDRAGALAAGSAAQAGGSALRSIASRAVRDLLAHQVQLARARPLAASSDSEPCGLSGKTNSTFDDRDNSGQISAGDVLTVVFLQCRDSASDQVDGTIVLTVTGVGAATATRTEFTGAMAFQQVNAVFGQTSTRIAGSVAMSVALTSSTLDLVLAVGSDGLGVQVQSPTYADAIAYAQGMRIAMYESLTGTPVSRLSFDGSFSATSIGGAVTLSTAQALVQSGDDDYPASGQVLVSGGAGSQLRVTVIDDTRLRLELDANGDGSFEGSSVVDWSALSPS